MAQSTTNLGKIHVFHSETLYNQFKDIIADNDLALLKDDGAYIIAANLAQNGYVKFSNGLILQWGYANNSASGITTINYHIPYSLVAMAYTTNHTSANSYSAVNINNCTLKSFDVHARAYNNGNLIFTNDSFNWLAIGKQQWGVIYNAKAGTVDSQNNNNVVTFPIPFTTVFALSPTFIVKENHPSRDVIVNLYSLSNTSAVIRCWDRDNATNDGQLTYIALGK